MYKIMYFSLLVFCGMFVGTQLNAQEVAKASCSKAKVACCDEAKASFAKEKTASCAKVAESSEAKTASARTVAEVNTIPTAALALLSTKGAEGALGCKPASCAPANCDPSDCPPECLKLCPPECKDAGKTKVASLQPHKLPKAETSKS